MKIEAIVEIPQYSKFKFEVKAVPTYNVSKRCFTSNTELVLDRVLNQEVPYTYGYVPETLCGDGDPLDIFIIANGYIPPFTRLTVEIIGGFECKDGGKEDNKLIGQLVGDETYPRIAMIKHYLETYKTNFEILRELDKEEAIKIFDESRVI